MPAISLPEIVANLGPLSIRAVYRKTDDSGGEGPAICLYEGPYKEGENEFLRIDLFDKDPHYHLNPDPKDASASNVNVEDLDAGELLDHVINNKSLSSLARKAGKTDIGAYLSDKGVGASIN